MRIVVFLFTIFICLDTYAITMGDAINTAGRQRMLSQRMTQAYILKGIQPDSKKHQAVFSRCFQEFEANLSTLQNFGEADAIDAALDAVIQNWTVFKQIAQQPSTKENATRLFIESNKLLPLAHEYVMALQKLANHSAAELVNIAGRQRMLSQRIAKNYVASYWGVGSESVEELLAEDLAEFEHMLSYLSASQLNTETINKKLVRTKGHFNYAARGIDGDMMTSGEQLIHVVTGTTDIMLYNMNVITGLYAEVMDKTR